METVLYETETIYTQREYKKYSYVIYRRINKIDIMTILLMLCDLIIVAIEYSKGDYVAAIKNIVYGSLFLILLKVIIEIKINKSWKDNRLIQGQKTQIKFYENYLEAISSIGNTKIDYDKLYKVLETKENFYLLINKAQGIVIEKCNCKEELIQYLKVKKALVDKK